MAPRPARRGRAGLRVEHRRVAGRPAHLMGRLPARPGPARPGPAGRGRRDPPEDTGPGCRGPPPAPPAGPAYVGLAEVAYQRNELDSALRQVTEGIALCRQFFSPAPLGTGLVTLAWIRQAQGDPGGALEAMAEAGRAALGPDVTALLNPVPSRRARLLPGPGEGAPAGPRAEERGLGPGDDPGYPREPEYLVLARVLLAQDRPAQALTLLETMLAAAAA